MNVIAEANASLFFKYRKIYNETRCDAKGRRQPFYIEWKGDCDDIRNMKSMKKRNRIVIGLSNGKAFLVML
ncbi:hypothetical protein A7975_18730 [Bacillus sp. FJAT-26390]|nr:hypothetical protein A7975_18730 [Bacillus sp. FJAT-26390]